MILNSQNNLVAATIKHLNKSIPIDMGIRVDYTKGNYPHFEMGISHSDVLLLEAIRDWIFGNKQSINDFSDIMRDHHSKLSDDQKRAVAFYTYNSDPMKDHLRNDGKDKVVDVTKEIDKGKAKLLLNIDHLDSAINSCKLPRNIITYSGIQNPESDRFHVFSKVHVSSSIDPLVAAKFSAEKMDKDGIGHIARIHNQKSQRGILVGNNPDLSFNEHEMEYIIPKNTHFSVEPVPEEVFNGDKLTHKIWNFHRIDAVDVLDHPLFKKLN